MVVRKTYGEDEIRYLRCRCCGRQQLWEAEVIALKSRLIVERTQGPRDENLWRRLLEKAHDRLCYPQGIVLFSDGEASYKTLFTEIFGLAYRPARQGSVGCLPGLHYHIARTQAHVQIVKQRLRKRVVQVDIRLAYGSQKRLKRELRRLGYQKPNTSAIERRNATARRMDAASVRKTLAFARTPETRDARGS